LCHFCLGFIWDRDQSIPSASRLEDGCQYPFVAFIGLHSDFPHGYFVICGYVLRQRGIRKGIFSSPKS
jgi:hypothetical protein